MMSPIVATRCSDRKRHDGGASARDGSAGRVAVVSGGWQARLVGGVNCGLARGPRTVLVCAGHCLLARRISDACGCWTERRVPACRRQIGGREHLAGQPVRGDGLPAAAPVWLRTLSVGQLLLSALRSLSLWPTRRPTLGMGSPSGTRVPIWNGYGGEAMPGRSPSGRVPTFVSAAPVSVEWGEPRDGGIGRATRE